jgi:hypothetical protein
MDFIEGGQWLYAMIGLKGEEHWSLSNYLFIYQNRTRIDFDRWFFGRKRKHK